MRYDPAAATQTMTAVACSLSTADAPSECRHAIHANHAVGTQQMHLLIYVAATCMLTAAARLRQFCVFPAGYLCMLPAAG
jgi:hypothetical protein